MKSKIDIIILRSNSVIYDVRVQKIDKSLSKKFNVLVMGWNREKLNDQDVSKYPRNLKLFNLKSPIGKPSLILYYPIFWAWIFYELIKTDPKIIHSCDLDTVIPAYFYKIIFRKKIVFDIFDRYAMVYMPKRIPLLYPLIQSVEEFCAKKSDTLITVSNKVLQTINQKPKINEIIMNCPEEIKIIKKESNSKLRVIYTGNIVKYRGLEVIYKSVKDLENVEFLYAGRIIDKDLFEKLSSITNFKYMGFLKPEDAAHLESQADVFIILYDPKIPLHNYSIPNKLFIAMQYGVPSITNLAPEIIQEDKCGIYSNYDDVEKIKQSLILLRDNFSIRELFGKKGRESFENKYNWEIMERKLFAIYDKLLSN